MQVFEKVKCNYEVMSVTGEGWGLAQRPSGRQRECMYVLQGGRRGEADGWGRGNMVAPKLLRPSHSECACVSPVCAFYTNVFTFF